MSDIFCFGNMYERLKYIKNNKVEFEKASDIINSAYLILEQTIETKNNSMYLKKTKKLLYEIDDIYLSSFNACLEDMIECSPSQFKEATQKIL
jgi:hypothetical protein